MIRRGQLTLDEKEGEELAKSATGIRLPGPINTVHASREDGASDVPFQDKDQGKPTDRLALIYFCAHETSEVNRPRRFRSSLVGSIDRRNRTPPP